MASTADLPISPTLPPLEAEAKPAETSQSPARDVPEPKDPEDKTSEKKARGRPRKNPFEEPKPKRPRGRPKKSNEPVNDVEETEDFTSPHPPPSLYATLTQETTSSNSGPVHSNPARLAAAAQAATAAVEANTLNGPHSPPLIRNNESYLAHAHKHVDFLVKNSPIYGYLLSNIEVVSASPAGIKTHLKLELHHVNSKGSLHGSVTATIVDFMGGLAIACFDCRSNTGVSTDLHVSYLGKATARQTIEIEGIAEKVGGTLAFTRIAIRTLKDDGTEGDLVAMGRHTKYVKPRS